MASNLHMPSHEQATTLPPPESECSAAAHERANENGGQSGSNNWRCTQPCATKETEDNIIVSTCNWRVEVAGRRHHLQRRPLLAVRNSSANQIPLFISENSSLACPDPCGACHPVLLRQRDDVTARALHRDATSPLVAEDVGECVSCVVGGGAGDG